MGFDDDDDQDHVRVDEEEDEKTEIWLIEYLWKMITRSFGQKMMPIALMI